MAKNPKKSQTLSEAKDPGSWPWFKDYEQLQRSFPAITLALPFSEGGGGRGMVARGSTTPGPSLPKEGD
jgi:hypothetical protein